VAKRRSDAEIEAVNQLHRQTYDTAREIGARVNGDDEGDSYVHVNARNIGGIRAEYQRDHATVIEVTFDTKDPALAERVALAIKAAVKEAQL
jgi:hypothetical protein